MLKPDHAYFLSYEIKVARHDCMYDIDMLCEKLRVEFQSLRVGITLGNVTLMPWEGHCKCRELICGGLPSLTVQTCKHVLKVISGYTLRIV
jgi:hypothetical protein